MCGIAGITQRDPELVKKMIDVLAHRGPDGEGLFLAQRDALTLGHRRLAIIDLSPRGNQPMSYSFGSREFVITFNGEIYNFSEIRSVLEKRGHVFCSTTDTEVVLAAFAEWGTNCVKEFRGMWAFALYDIASRKLFMSRDPFGKKPLYYYHKGKTLCFASEIKPILLLSSLKPVANELIVADYLSRNLICHTNETFFKDILMLPGGHSALFDLDRNVLDIQCYYTLPGGQCIVDENEFRQTLYQAVRRRLVSDVPIAISLSGGVDSSSIAAIIAETSHSKYSAFTTSSISTIGDETELVSTLLKRYPQYSLFKESVDLDEFAQVQEKLLYHMEEPLWNDSAYVRWVIAQGVKRRGFKVLLTGEGADEVLAGYPMAHPYFLRDLLLSKKAFRCPRELFFLANDPERAFVFFYFMRLLRRKGHLEYSPDPRATRFLTMRMRQAASEVSGNYDIPSSLQGLLRSQLLTFFLPYLLLCNDKISMAHSVEGRAPFLDLDFVQMALQIPTSSLIGDGLRKRPLRDAMADRVPREIIFRRKKDAFASSLDSFFRGKDGRRTFVEMFRDASTSMMIEPAPILSAYNETFERQQPIPDYFIRFYWLEKWSRMFNVQWKDAA